MQEVNIANGGSPGLPVELEQSINSDEFDYSTGARQMPGIDLTADELAVLVGWLNGQTTAQIAHELSMSTPIVRVNLDGLRAKFEQSAAGHPAPALSHRGRDLTARELDVLDLLVQGLTNQQVARKLFISRATAKFHVSSILSKLGAATRTEAVALAFQFNLVSPREAALPGWLGEVPPDRAARVYTNSSGPLGPASTGGLPTQAGPEPFTTEQAQWRALSARLETAREEERARIARELHDKLGGALTGLKLGLASAGQSASDQPRQLSALAASIDSTIDMVRHLAFELRPPELDDGGLVGAVLALAEDFEARTGLECNVLGVSEDMQVEPAIATGLFRVLQESLTNIVRHARASRVTISLEVVEEQLVLKVIDDGRGLDPAVEHKRRSLGLMGMRERVDTLSGQFSIHSEPGRGTAVTVRVPHSLSALV